MGHHIKTRALWRLQPRRQDTNRIFPVIQTGIFRTPCQPASGLRAIRRCDTHVLLPADKVRVLHARTSRLSYLSCTTRQLGKNSFHSPTIIDHLRFAYLKSQRCSLGTGDLRGNLACHRSSKHGKWDQRRREATCPHAHSFGRGWYHVCGILTKTKHVYSARSYPMNRARQIVALGFYKLIEHKPCSAGCGFFRLVLAHLLGAL